MSYVNTGAFINGTRAKSKKALKEALAADPSSVSFDVTTAAMFHHGPDVFTGVSMPDAGITLSVCGPDPYTKRNWWANVTVEQRTGKIKVS